MIKRRDVLKTALGAGICSWLPAQQTRRDKRPNFVLIVADDLGWGDLGIYGHEEIRTPNLDRLGRQGTIFTQFYVGGPVCSPSRACFMTGEFPAKTQILRPLAGHKESMEMGIPDFLDPATPTVMRQLKQAGYVTGHFGKWHLSTNDAPGGFREPDQYGVDEYKIYDRKTKLPEHYIPHQGANHSIAANQPIFDEGIKFIEAHKDQPFYLNLSSPTPHIPLYPTAEEMAPFKALRPHDPWPSIKQIYYAAVSVLDQHVGRFLKRLDELGLADNTVVMFTSDNGPEGPYLNEPGNAGIGSTGPFRGHKVSLYEGGIRLPFLVRWPGKVRADRVESSIVHGADLYPTMCKLAGIDVPANVRNVLDGEDVSDIFLGASRARKTTLYWENQFWYYGGQNDPPIHRSPILAIRDGDWKLLMNPDGKRRELYNIPRDPSEVANKIDTEPELARRLSGKLMKWFESMPKGVRTTPPNMGDNTYAWPISNSRDSKKQ